MGLRQSAPEFFRAPMYFRIRQSDLDGHGMISAKTTAQEWMRCTSTRDSEQPSLEGVRECVRTASRLFLPIPIHECFCLRNRRMSPPILGQLGSSSTCYECTSWSAAN